MAPTNLQIAQSDPNATFNATTGQYNMPGAITVDSLKPVTPLNIPTPTPTSNQSGLVDSSMASQKSLQDYIASITPAPTATDTANQTILDRISSLTETGAGKSQALAQEKINAGLPEFQKQLQDLNNQILTGNADYTRQLAENDVQQNALGGNGVAEQASVLEAQRYGLTQAQNSKLALKAANLGLLSARAQAAAGNIQTALSIAQNAVDAKYAPIEDELKIRQAQLNAIKPEIDRQTDRQGKAFQLLLQNRQKEIDDERQKVADEKANQKSIQEMIVNASAQGASQDVINQAANAKTSVEAAKILGKYSGEYLKYEMLKEQIKTEKLQQSKISSDISKTRAEINALSNPSGTVPSEYQGALDVILGSEKFTKEQKASITNAVKNGQNPFSVVKNQAKNIMGQTEASALSKLETASSQLKAIDSTLKDFYANGGNTNLFKGKYEEVVNKLGEVNDPKLVTLATQMAVAMQKYRLAVTGTAASVKEDARIEAIFPGITNKQGLNQAKINGLLASFNTDIDTTYENVLGDSYKVIKNAQAASDPNNPFNKALGSTSSTIPGTIIIGGTNTDGTLNFNIPGYKSGIPSIPSVPKLK